MPSAYSFPFLRIAIIGGGLGGLSSAIALSKLPNVEVAIYEQARELREIGAGIQIGFNCWKVLELLGADQDVRGHVQENIIQRNGLTGVPLKKNESQASDPKYRGQRVRRTRLQNALKKQVPEGMIKLRKRLSSVTDLGEEGVRIVFEDGEEVIADLLIGGDGIRSVVRAHVFPDHSLQFTGRTIWRTIIPRTLVADIPDMIDTAWWHGPAGHFYNCLVDDTSDTPEEEQMFEIAVHNVVPAATVKEKRFSWGIPATNERVESHFTEYDPRVRNALSRVPQGLWKEFSAFSGPRLKKVIAGDKIVLIGDASHPLTGAFGSGAAFAMQDSWILAQAIAHTRSLGQSLGAALEIFDTIRSPYYHQMYDHLDAQAKTMQEAKAKNPNQTFEDALEVKVNSFGGVDKLGWIYSKDIKEVWEEYLRTEGAQPSA